MFVVPLSLPLLLHTPFFDSFHTHHHSLSHFHLAPQDHDNNNLVMVSWELPPFQTYKLNTDGCSKGNPGESGSGGIIRDFTGRFVAGFSYRLGFDCAAHAEIWALYQGLKLAQKTINTNAELLIECDSIEVVSVILGQHGNNYKYVDLVESCWRLLKTFKTVNIRHVYREANQCADYLANKSLTLDMGLHQWSTPPDFHLLDLIRNDVMGMAIPRVCKGFCKPRFYK